VEEAMASDMQFSAIDGFFTIAPPSISNPPVGCYFLFMALLEIIL
jgi:hypothetical protein